MNKRLSVSVRQYEISAPQYYKYRSLVQPVDIFLLSSPSIHQLPYFHHFIIVPIPLSLISSHQLYFQNSTPAVLLHNTSQNLSLSQQYPRYSLLIQYIHFYLYSVIMLLFFLILPMSVYYSTISYEGYLYHTGWDHGGVGRSNAPHYPSATCHSNRIAIYFPYEGVPILYVKVLGLCWAKYCYSLSHSCSPFQRPIQTVSVREKNISHITYEMRLVTWVSK